MSIPQWADADFSQKIPTLRQVGEGQEIEYKEDIPAQASDLGKDVAAFGTSGGGQVLLGIADDGSLGNLKFQDSAGRDAFTRRVLGILSNIKPALKPLPKLVYGTEEDKVILSIVVEKQDAHPIFYHNHCPYIRDCTISRPATPEEVQDLVWKHPSSEQKRFDEEFRRKQMTQLLDLNQA